MHQSNEWWKSICQTRVQWLFSRRPLLPRCMWVCLICVSLTFPIWKRPRARTSGHSPVSRGVDARSHGAQLKMQMGASLTLKGQAPHVGICIWNMRPMGCVVAISFTRTHNERRAGSKTCRSRRPLRQLLFIIYVHCTACVSESAHSPRAFEINRWSDRISLILYSEDFFIVIRSMIVT